MSVSRIARVGRVARAGQGGLNPFFPTSALVPSSGDPSTVTVAFSLTTDTTGTNGFTMSASGGPVTVTSILDEGPDTLLFLSRSITTGETVTISYSPGNMKSASGLSLPAFSNFPVVNLT